jgi:hypothetical protein
MKNEPEVLGRTNWSTFFWYDTDRIKKRSVHSFIVAYVFVAAVTQPLPFNDREIHTQVDYIDLLRTSLRWAQVL